MKKGTDYLNSQLKKKYGVDINDVEERERQEQEKKFKAATLKRDAVVARSKSKEDPLEKQLTQFYWQYDPTMLSQVGMHFLLTSVIEQISNIDRIRALKK